MTKPVQNRRYHALDCVRAAAMLLGVLYHAIVIGFMLAGPFRPGPGGMSILLPDWLHSFRMPLFFLISGFFCGMMRQKYGLNRYLQRRWTRIGLPLLLGLFTLIPLYQVLNFGLPGRGMGPPAVAPGPGGGPGMRPGELPPPPPGFMPPPFVPFDADEDGSLNADEWARALAELPPPGRFGPGGPEPNAAGPPGGPMPMGPPGGPEGFGPGPGGPPPFGPSAGGLGSRIFGRYSLYFSLSYLWFLWYLLVFATIAPIIASLAARIIRSQGPTDRLGLSALRHDLAPLGLGLLCGPLLRLTPSFMGWSLPPAAGVFRGVPDFLFHLERDMPFYFAFFLAGWWLYRLRDALPDIARLWFRNLLIGLVAHAGAVVLSGRFAMRFDLPQYQWIHLGGLTLSTIGSAYTAFGILGFFQRFVDRPTRVGRYLADTAFWVYLIHQPLLAPLLRVFIPLGLSWWLQALIVTTLTGCIALALYELIVRPTSLVRLFGPAALARNVAPAGLDPDPAHPSPKADPLAGKSPPASGPS